MIARNTAKTVSLLRSCRAVIDAAVDNFHGRMFTEAGDGFLIEFNSTSNAVKCAVALQNQMRDSNCSNSSVEQIWLRTGIDVGDVLDDDGDLHGNNVNIAVRLQEAAPAGGVLISDQVRSVTKNELCMPLKDVGELKLKNISIKVRVYEIEIAGADIFYQLTDDLGIDLYTPVAGFGKQTAVAVLPLTNVSSNVDYDHITDGFSDSLILAMSHMRQFPVIDRNSSFRFRDSGADARAIGNTLGARYLVDGELLEIDGQFRISIRLVDCDNASIIWSEKFNSTTKNIIDDLEDISIIIAATIEGRLEREEGIRARSMRISKIDVPEVIWRGKWHLNKLTKEDSFAAKHLFDQALDVEPENGEALIQLGYWHWIYCWSQRRPHEDLHAFRDIAFRAINANELDSRGHFLLGSAEILLSAPDVAIGHFSEALHLNPSSAHSLAQIGSCYMLLSEPEKAIDHLKAAIRLNPQDYYIFVSLGEMACSYCMLERWDEAIALARRSQSLRPYYWHARMTEIAALSKTGRRLEAVRALNALLVRRPDFLTENYINWLPFADRSWNEYFQTCISKVHAEFTLRGTTFDVISPR